LTGRWGRIDDDDAFVCLTHLLTFVRANVRDPLDARMPSEFT
jgi:hypothetical protein